MSLGLNSHGLYNKLIPHHYSQNVITYAHAKNVIHSALIALIVTPSFASLYYFLGFHLAGGVIAITGSIYIGVILLFQHIRRLGLIREISVGILYLCIAWLTYQLGGINASSTYWLAIPPLLSVLFGGLRSGIVWSCISVVTIVAIYWLEYSNYPIPASPIENTLLLQLLSAIGLIAITFTLVYFFEKQRQEWVIEIQNKNKQLKISNEKANVLFKKAIDANVLKSEFLENMSHELRTPLHAIVGFTELLQRGNISQEVTQEYLGYIQSSINHLSQMISDMLDVSTFQFGIHVFHSEPVVIATILNGVIDIFHSMIKEKKIDLNFHIDELTATVVTDPVRLKQIFFHLISNAIKFTEENGKISVRIYPVNGKQFIIEVTDTGIGIDQADIPKLFMPFQQLDASVSKKYPGTGTGLALVRRIAEAQGGQVGVESSLGKGSKFYVILPMPIKS